MTGGGEATERQRDMDGGVAMHADGAGAQPGGSSGVNGYRTIHVSVPFGGFGASGHGRSSGIEALSEYTTTKAVWIETAASPSIPFGYGPVPTV